MSVAGDVFVVRLDERIQITPSRFGALGWSDHVGGKPCLDSG